MPAEPSPPRQNPAADDPPAADAATTPTATERQALDAALRESEAARTALAAANEELHRATAALAERTAAAERAGREAEAARQVAVAAVAQLQTLFAQAPAVIAVTAGPEHRFVLANARAEQVAGRTGLVGRTYREAFPELDAQGFVDLLDRVYATGEPFVATEVPITLVHGEGRREEGWYSFVYQPLTDATGRVTGIMQHAVEVTAQVRAREVMAAREQDLRTLADAIPTLAWTAQADGYIDWYNARWYEYTGTTPEQMSGWGWQSVHDPAVLPHVLEEWHAAIATGRPTEMTFPLRGADGAFRPFLTRITPLKDAVGRVVRWFGTNTDVGAERAARAAAERAVARTERLQALTAALAGAQTLDDVAGIVVSQVAAATNARTAMLALRTGESDDARVIGQTGLTAHVRPPHGLFPISTTPGPASEVLRTGEPLWVTGEAGDALLARFPESAPVWTGLDVAALATVPLTVGGAAVGVISFTFTEPRAFTPEDRAFFLALGRQAAQAVERARLLEAESAARAAADVARAAAEAANQVKTDFLATMSHELRTPLNAIAGYAELLDLGIHGPVTDQQREAISRIQRSQRHLTGLINDVLNFAKLEAGRVEYHLTDIPVHAALDALEPLVMPQLHAKRLHYERAPCDQALAVRADAEKLQQVLVNLLSNAIKFTAVGGTVTLFCDDGPGVVRLAVRDTGIGIPLGRLDDAFAPFVQVARRLNAPHEGTGLGLAISRDLARGMGGDLTAVSEPGAGSTFSLTLPRA